MSEPSAPPAPPKPGDFALWLYRSTVTKLIVARRWHKDDGSDERTTVYFTDENRNETESLEHRLANAIVDFRPDYCSACRLKPEVAEKCRAWVDFTKSHADKLAQFEKLKSELGL